jgi:hypothetical protein
MKGARHIVLLWIIACFCLLSSCNGDSGQTVPPQDMDYIVRALVIGDEVGLSVLALLMDHRENLVSDALLTINEEALNVGFLAPEDGVMDQQEKRLSDSVDHTAEGVPSGNYLPYYFLEFLDLPAGAPLDLEAKGSLGRRLYFASSTVPEKITLLEPSPGATFPVGQSVHLRWEGGEPCTHFLVVYLGGDGEFKYSADVPQGKTEYTIPAHVIEEGEVYLFVSGYFEAEGTGPASPDSTWYITEMAWTTNALQQTGSVSKLSVAACKDRCWRELGRCFREHPSGPTWAIICASHRRACDTQCEHT